MAATTRKTANASNQFFGRMVMLLSAIVQILVGPAAFRPWPFTSF
jgi:hypothetical protein